MHEGEEMVGESGRVGVVLLGRQVGLVIQQPVEDIGGVTVADVDEFAVEGRVLVRDVGVDEPAGLRPVLGVHMPGGFGFAAGPEPLPVGRGRGAITPLGGEGVGVLGIDQLRAVVGWSDTRLGIASSFGPGFAWRILVIVATR